ncbi:MAG: DUF2442 domain-containing protein [Bacteroidales bacterium]|nr:DUF2442 domain-containing protein [Bacteroidales bacterium]MCF8458257.1 DUF2442 domain-containing protein [Bacteroidales bacterium]
MKLISVIKAEYKGDFKVFLEFDDGTSGIVDLKNHLDGEVFEPIRNIETFKNFTLDSWTIGWNNEADFSPEFLYNLVIKG